MKKFRKKPVAIEAIQYTGENQKECFAFCQFLMPQPFEGNVLIMYCFGMFLWVAPGDWIVKSGDSSFSHFKPDDFEATYEEVKE